ncbi:hypothetical protein GCM10027169_05180 [Gordonia jinhuaensis]|uniref:Type VII secretion-associated protein, Rv3446c family, C-terminal domain-containing protein n=2 Tax=Gordonia jinhuaensis TaxID=1517702 RepID=A0A916SWR7_9ACTN|nr:hypothetical protein GCM10011489_02140 [Gordonia jinhuaensis]
MLGMPVLTSRLFDGRSAHVVDIAGGRVTTLCAESPADVREAAAVRDEASERVVSRDVSRLVADIDLAVVAVDGHMEHAVQAWTRVISEVLGRAGVHHDMPILVAAPTVWGPIRRRALSGLDAVSCVVAVVPRAVVIADTHCDSWMRAAVVIEHQGERLDIHRVERDPVTGWDVVRTRVVDEIVTGRRLADRIAADPVFADPAIFGDDVEVVLVDTDTDTDAESDGSGRRLELLGELALACRVGPVVAVRREVIRRFGGRAPVRAFRAAADTDARPRARSVRHRVRATAVLAAAVGVIAAVSAGHGAGSTEDTDHVRPVSLGRVRMLAPAEWVVRSDGPPSAPAGAAARTVYAHGHDGRRIVVIQSQIRRDATQASVAASLRARIAERRDVDIDDFSPATTYAGRAVISYREIPGSGGQVRWYVLVGDRMQVSVGCQAGDAGESIERHCRLAIGSLRVAVDSEGGLHRDVGEVDESP